jgi:hypothetical protein
VRRARCASLAAAARAPARRRPALRELALEALDLKQAHDVDALLERRCSQRRSPRAPRRCAR